MYIIYIFVYMMYIYMKSIVFSLESDLTWRNLCCKLLLLNVSTSLTLFKLLLKVNNSLNTLALINNHHIQIDATIIDILVLICFISIQILLFLPHKVDMKCHFYYCPWFHCPWYFKNILIIWSLENVLVFRTFLCPEQRTWTCLV